MRLSIVCPITDKGETMPTGTITRFFMQQGFGYITPDDNDGDYVVLVDELQASLESQFMEGTRVTFDEGDADMGLRASNVQILSEIQA